MCPRILPWDNRRASWSGIFHLRSCFWFLCVRFMTKIPGNGDKNGQRTPCAWLLRACACLCAHRERVGGLAWSFHPAIFNIWTAHYPAEFKPLVFGMFTEVFPSETSKPNTGTDPWYLTSIQMGEGWAAGWVQRREERDPRDWICDINLNAYTLRSANCKVISALILCKPERLILFVSEMNVGLGQGFLWAWGRLDDIEQCSCFIR